MFTVWKPLNNTYLRYINIFVPTKEIADKFYELGELFGKEILNYYPVYMKDMQRLSDLKKLVLEFERTPEKDRSLYSKIFGYEECSPLPEDIYKKALSFLAELHKPIYKFKQEQEAKEMRERRKREREQMAMYERKWKERQLKERELEERRSLQNVEIEPYRTYYVDESIRRLYQPLA